MDKSTRSQTNESGRIGNEEGTPHLDSSNTHYSIPFVSQQTLNASMATPMPTMETPTTAPRPRSISALDLVCMLVCIWVVDFALMGAIEYLTYEIPRTISRYFDLVPFLMMITALSWAFTLGLCIYLGCKRYGISMRQGFSFNNVSPKALQISVVLGIGFAVCVIGYPIIEYYLSGQEPYSEASEESKVPITRIIEEDAASNSSGIPWYFMSFAVLLAPLLEELYYRGFLFRAFQRHVGTKLSAALIILWFGVIHADQVGGSLSTIAIITTMGAVCTFLRIYYDSVLPSIACHFCYNGTLMGATMLGLIL